MKNTNDGGQNWHSQSKIPRSYWFNDVHFVNSRIGWVVGSDFWTGKSILLKTTNGGNNWFSQDCGLESNIRDVSFIDSLNGWVVSGKPVGTKDGGRTWEDTNLSLITSVLFVNADTGWAFGNSIYRTNDGGLTWINQYTSTGLLDDPHFINKYVGWAINSYKQLLMTRNGGNDWYVQKEYDSYHIYDVFFIDETTGWAVGERLNGLWLKGIILKTANGGKDWHIKLENIDDAKSVYFLNYEIGWVTGNGSKIYKTIDGGENWLLSATGDSRYLESVFFTDDGTGWIVGNWGAILKLEKGNITTIDLNTSKCQSKTDEYILLQNYPNPFNSVTIIPIHLANNYYITLRIYDLLGKEITTLSEEWLTAGKYNFQWNAWSFASGVYFYRLKAKDCTGKLSVDCKKLILLK